MSSRVFKRYAWLRGTLFILSLVAVAFLFDQTRFDASWIDHEVRGKGITGELLFIGTGAVCAALGVPRLMIAFLGGYAFGFIMGSLWSLLATVLGCVASFYYARFFGRTLATRRFPDQIKKIDGFIHDHPFSMTLLVRLLPVGNNLVTNLAAGVSSVRQLPFFAGSLLGYVPQTLILALIGSGIHVDPGFRIGVGVISFILSAVLGTYLYRRAALSG